MRWPSRGMRWSPIALVFLMSQILFWPHVAAAQLPVGWTSGDVGTMGVAGIVSESVADAFRFLWRGPAGEGQDGSVLPAYVSMLPGPDSTWIGCVSQNDPRGGTVIGTVSLPPISPNSMLLVTSHDTTRTATTVFDRPPR